MAENINTSSYNDDTITYFEEILCSSPTEMTSVNLINPSQSLCTEFPPVTVSSETMAEVTTVLTMLSNSIPATQSTDIFLNPWQQVSDFKQTDIQESGDTLGLLQNVVGQSGLHTVCDNFMQQNHPSVTSGTDILRMSHSLKDTHCHTLDTMDTNGSGQHKESMVTEKTQSDSDTVLLEQLNAIFDQYSGGGSPEVTSTIDEQIKFVNEPLATCTKTASPVTKTSAKLKVSGSHKSAKRSTDDQYRKVRERNNMAVKKSRAKAKERQMNAEAQVVVLHQENKELKKKVESLSSELNTLKSLLTNVVAARPDVVSVIKAMGSTNDNSANQS